MSSSRGRRVKRLGAGRSDYDVFWMSLDEARRVIADKYEFLADRLECQYPKHKPKPS